MRRNYVAVMLGLALTVSSISAFASEGTTEAGTEVTTEAATEAASEASEKEATTTVYGQVTEVTSDSITITKGDLVGGAADTENTEDTTEAAADSEETTEAAADGTEDTTEAATEASTEADAKESLTLELSTEAATYKFAPDAVITELASTEDITAEDAAEAEATTESATEESTEAATEAATEAGTEAVIGEADETTGVEVAEESSEAADDKIEITTDDILAGDIVALEVNADGEVTSLTILAYGTGSYVDTTEAETDLAEEALLGDEASTEAVTE